jgi:hypothetical protein
MNLNLNHKKAISFFIYPCSLIKVNVDAEVNLKRGEIERKEVARSGGLRGEMRGREKKREKGRRGGCEKMMRGRELGGAAAAECYFRFRVFPIYICIFLSAGMVEPVRFGSIGFRL